MTEHFKKQLDSTLINPIQSDFSWPGLAKNRERKFIFSYLKERFGIGAEVFDDYLIFKKRKSWRILRKSDSVLKAARLKSVAVGLKAFQEINNFIKPTTRFIQIFGKMARKAVYDISGDELTQLLSGEPIDADIKIDNGYVILRLEGCILGLGLLINGKIHSQIPKKDLIGMMPPDILA